MTSPVDPTSTVAVLARVDAARRRNASWGTPWSDQQLATKATAHITDDRDRAAARIQWLVDNPLGQYDEEVRRRLLGLTGLPLHNLLETVTADLRADLVDLGMLAHSNYLTVLNVGGAPEQMPDTFNRVIRDDQTYLQRCGELVDQHLGVIVERTQAWTANLRQPGADELVSYARTQMEDIAGLVGAVGDGRTARPVYANAAGPVFAARTQVYDTMHALLGTPGHQEEITRLRLLLAAPTAASTIGAAEVARGTAMRVFVPPTSGRLLDAAERGGRAPSAADVRHQPSPSQSRRR